MKTGGLLIISYADSDNLQRSFDCLTDEMVESLNAVFKINHVTGAVLFRFTDEEWKELIPAVCLRVHVRDAFKRVIKNDEKAALSQLHRKGLSKKPISELTQMVPFPRITSFFRPLSVLALPDHDHLSSLPMDPCLPVESVNIIDLESVTKLIQHLLSMRERSDFSCRLMRKAICTFVSLNDNNIRHAATKQTPLSVSCGSKEKPETLEERWRSKVKYYRKEDLSDINLEEFITRFKAHGNIKSIKRGIFGAAAVVRHTHVLVGPKPVWGVL